MPLMVLGCYERKARVCVPGRRRQRGQWHDPAVTQRTLQADAKDGRAQFRGAKTAVVVRHHANRDLSGRLLHDQPTQLRRAASEVGHYDKAVEVRAN
jgi:hypothetical protein